MPILQSTKLVDLWLLNYSLFFAIMSRVFSPNARHLWRFCVRIKILMVIFHIVSPLNCLFESRKGYTVLIHKINGDKKVRYFDLPPN